MAVSVKMVYVPIVSMVTALGQSSVIAIMAGPDTTVKRLLAILHVSMASEFALIFANVMRAGREECVMCLCVTIGKVAIVANVNTKILVNAIPAGIAHLTTLLVIR